MLVQKMCLLYKKAFDRNHSTQPSQLQLSSKISMKVGNRHISIIIWDICLKIPIHSYYSVNHFISEYDLKSNCTFKHYRNSS